MQRKPVCYVYGAGERHGAPPEARPGDLVIAADGGYAYLRALGRSADLVIGDFDSLGEPPPDAIVLPRAKDDTDMAAALEIGWARGYRSFHLYGGTGGRLDHTLANIQCLAGLARRGGRGYLFDRDTVVTAIHCGEVAFPASARGTLSVFAHSDTAEGVCEQGLAYALEGATLQNTRALGVSNAFVGVPSRVSVARGTLILIYPRGTEEAD